MAKNITAYSPLEQFEIVTILPIKLAGYNISITNSTLILIISITLGIF